MVSQMLPVGGVQKEENTEKTHAHTHRGHQKAFKT